jgi:hypothetical protein
MDSVGIPLIVPGIRSLCCRENAYKSSRATGAVAPGRATIRRVKFPNFNQLDHLIAPVARGDYSVWIVPAGPS